MGNREHDGKASPKNAGNSLLDMILGNGEGGGDEELDEKEEVRAGGGWFRLWGFSTQ